VRTYFFLSKFSWGKVERESSRRRQQLIKIAQHFDLHKLGGGKKKDGAAVKRESFPSSSSIFLNPRKPRKVIIICLRCWHYEIEISQPTRVTHSMSLIRCQKKIKKKKKLEVG